MPTPAHTENGELESLLAFLAAQRGAIRRAALGLTDEQAAATPTAGALSVGGLVKHAANRERGWIVGTLMGRDLGERPDETTWADDFRLLEGETLAGWLKEYQEVATETEAIIRGLPSLESDCALPEAPWFPKGRRTARWILLHLIEEAARHAGHADIVRESIDGRTAFELAEEERAAGGA
ncbi:DinB family protein [Kitasatospora indigofera]|uniref:DinB family protein n=1 Tax=Kitasatospora indigofera TaxID=67307 RepID=UPI0036BE163B